MNDENCELTERELYVAHTVGAHYEAKLKRILTRVVVAVAAVALIVIVGVVGGWIFVRQEGVHRTDDIQANRRQVLIDGCMETNKRNTDTLTALDKFLPRGKPPTARQRQGIQSTKLLIAALAPYRGNPLLKGRERTASERAACAAYAHMRLGSG